MHCSLPPPPSQVLGASDDSASAVGRQRHPFFFLGFELGPNDPSGWKWFVPRGLAGLWLRLVAGQCQRKKQGNADADTAAGSGGGVTMLDVQAAGAGTVVRQGSIRDIESSGGRGRPPASEKEPDDVAAERSRVENCFAALWALPPGVNPPLGVEGQGLPRGLQDRRSKGFPLGCPGDEEVPERRASSPMTSAPDDLRPPAVLLRGLRKVYGGKVREPKGM